jgi:DNA-3-methyladenine glycosylase I
MPDCEWPGNDDLMKKYHDEEWGKPNHSDVKHFEFLILEGAQAGLSWKTILNRRSGYRKAFLEYDWDKVAQMDDSDVKRLLEDPGIIRNRLKINSAINNATRFIQVRKEFGSFDKYLWNFTNDKVIDNKPQSLK